MTSLPLHPILVHLPLALAALMPLLTGGLLFAWWRNALPRRTWVLVCAAQLLLVAGGIAAMRSGEADEERVERVVPEAAIEAHEEAAELFVWAAGAVLLVSLGVLLPVRPRLAQGLGLATVLASAVVTLLAVRVGEAGGELVYRHGAAAAHAPGLPAGFRTSPTDID